MNTLEEINELKEVLDSAISSCRLSKTRCIEMIQLHPTAGNEKYLKYDKSNLNILECCRAALDDLQPYPDED